MSDLYENIFLIIIIISLDQILLSYIANTSRTRAHAHTHAHTQRAVAAVNIIAIRLVCGAQPWRPALLATMAGRWPLEWTLALAARFPRSFGCISRIKKIARPNWDANLWQDVLSDDTNSLRHLPRRSSKNCDLQFVNFDRFKENYSIDDFCPLPNPCRCCSFYPCMLIWAYFFPFCSVLVWSVSLSLHRMS